MLEDETEALVAWSALGTNTSIRVIVDSSPLSSALPNSLALSVPHGSIGDVGFANSGYWGLHPIFSSNNVTLTWTIGIKVDSAWTYNASLYYRFPNATSFSGTLKISLQSSSSAVLASTSLRISGSQTNWTQLKTTLIPKVNVLDTNNTFTVTMDGADAAGQSINFALFSLFPPTYKGRENGMRMDIAEVSGY